MSEFVTADSGERLEFDSGMRRDTADGKINWLLIRPGPMMRRWAELMTRGSAKYEADRKPGELRNWQKASGVAELERFKESAARHFEHWLNGTNETNPETGEPIIEDHAAGVFFNINGAEYVIERAVELTEPTFAYGDRIVYRHFKPEGERGTLVKPEGEWLACIAPGEQVIRLDNGDMYFAKPSELEHA